VQVCARVGVHACVHACAPLAPLLIQPACRGQQDQIRHMTKGGMARAAGTVLLCCAAGAEAFAPGPALAALHPGPARPALLRVRSAALRMQGDDGGDGKWSVAVQDEAAERIESVKAGVLSAVAGSIAMAPIGVALLQFAALPHHTCAVRAWLPP